MMAVEIRINMTTVNVLREMDDGSGFFADLVEEYVDQSDMLIETIATAMSARDEEQIRFSVHTLKGSSFNVGADQLADLCQQIEDANALGDYAELQLLLSKLQAVFQTTSEELRSLA